MAVPLLILGGLVAGAVPVMAEHPDFSASPPGWTGVGSDISWPQCGSGYPNGLAFGIVGVNGGRPDTANPCLVSEFQWAQAAGSASFYLNTANPGATGEAAYRDGYDSAYDGYMYAAARFNAGRGHTWWLDVETANSWSSDTAANTLVIAGALAFLRAQGLVAGIYSTPYQWRVITGGAQMSSVANWVAGASDATEAPSFCGPSHSFSGGPVVMTQYTTQFDYDYRCPAASPPSLGPPAPPTVPLVSDVTALLNTVLGWLNRR